MNSPGKNLFYAFNTCFWISWGVWLGAEISKNHTLVWVGIGVGWLFVILQGITLYKN
jgi:hypothetical protein